MTEINIKPATADEKQWAAALLSSSEPWITLGITYEKCLKTCHDPEFSLFIAHIEQTPCGVMILDPRGLAGSPYIKSVAVSGEYRNRKIGAALLAYTEELCRRQSRFLFLCVSSFNTQAQKFYEYHGFVRVGELKDYIVEGKSEIIMYKRL
jgi:[ribosomal protein S18]-alanine N-acetyltransferase